MRFASFAAAAAILIAAPLAAQHPLTGTWKIDLATAKLPEKPSVVELKDGVYSSPTATPPIRIVADGKFHPDPGRDYHDETAIDASDPARVTFQHRRKGKLVATSVTTLSADGNTRTSEWTSSDNPAGVPLKGVNIATRIAPAPPGAHPISGAWRAVSRAESEAGTVLKVAVEGRTARVSQPTGESYEATIDGPFVPMKGDPSGLVVQVTQPDPRSLEETGKRGEEIVYVTRVTASEDSRTATVVSRNQRNGATTTFTAMRQ